MTINELIKNKNSHALVEFCKHLYRFMGEYGNKEEIGYTIFRFYDKYIGTYYNVKNDNYDIFAFLICKKLHITSNDPIPQNIIIEICKQKILR